MKTLLPFQETGVKFLCSKRAALLADEMGLGKTIQAIWAAKELHARHILIVCPASLKYNWLEEWRAWDNRKLCFEVINGSKAVIPKSADVVIVNYDLLQYDHIHKQLTKRRWDIGIFDESHYLRTRTSKRTRAVLLKRGIAHRCDYKWFLSGTPILNRPSELYPILKSCASHIIEPYNTYEKYSKYFCGAFWDGWQWNDKGASNTQELNRRLNSGFMLRRTKDQVLGELPDKRYQVIPLHIKDPKTKGLVSKELNWSKSEAKKVAVPDGTDSVSMLRHELALAKVPKAVELIREILETKQKLVVMAYHRDVLSEIFQHLGGAMLIAMVHGGISAEGRQEAVDAFQNDISHPLFLGQIQAAGVGINLTAADHILFVESSWVPGEIDQAVDRIHRIGQKESVLVQFLVWYGSLEERMLRTVIDKKQVVKQVTEFDLNNLFM